MSQNNWVESAVTDVRFNFTQMYTHSQTKWSVKKQSDTTCPIVEP